MATTPDEIPTPQLLPPPRKNFLSRLLTRPAIWRWGLIIIGLLLASGGIYNATSQVVTYQRAEGTVQLIANVPGQFMVSFNAMNNTSSPTFYVCNVADFTPTLNLDNSYDTITLPTGSIALPRPNKYLGSKVVLVYRSDKVMNWFHTITSATPEIAQPRRSVADWHWRVYSLVRQQQSAVSPDWQRA